MQVTQLATLVIRHRLTNFLSCVHDEWPSPYDRFVNRFAAEQQRCSVLCAIDADVFPCPVKQADLCRADGFRTVHPQGAFEHHERCRIAIGHSKVCPLVARQAQIPHMYGSKGLGWPRLPGELASDHAYRSVAIREA